MGSNWVVVKSSADAATMTDATMFMAMRFMLAAAFFIPFLKPDKKIAKAGLEIGVWYALGYVTQVRARNCAAASRVSRGVGFLARTAAIVHWKNGALRQ